MNKLLADVVKFHKTYGQPVVEHPSIPSKGRQDLRVALISEELEELKEAFAANDIVAVADAIVDLLYVVNGTAVECGLKDYIDDCHNEVQASNMSKLGVDGKPIYKENGKVAKGPNFFEPNLKDIILKHKFTTFERLVIGDHFRYQGVEYMKTSDNIAVSQDTNNLKNRKYLELNPACPVEVVR